MLVRLNLSKYFSLELIRSTATIQQDRTIFSSRNVYNTNNTLTMLWLHFRFCCVLSWFEKMD